MGLGRDEVVPDSSGYRSVRIHGPVMKLDKFRACRIALARRINIVGLDGDELPACPMGIAGRLRSGNRDCLTGGASGAVCAARDLKGRQAEHHPDRP